MPLSTRQYLASRRVTGTDIDPLDILMRFTRFKVNPAINLVGELAIRKTVVGEERTPQETLIRAMIPLFIKDALEVGKEEGFGAAFGTLGATGLGLGVQQYENKRRTRRR